MNKLVKWFDATALEEVNAIAISTKQESCVIDISGSPSQCDIANAKDVDPIRTKERRKYTM
jgi:hypothetical protein